MSDSNDVITDPRLEKRTRRRFSVAKKKRLLAEAGALTYVDKGAWLQRKGLYAGQLSTRRKVLAEHGEAGVAARRPGRKPADPRNKELERLKKAKEIPGQALFESPRPSPFAISGSTIAHRLVNSPWVGMSMRASSLFTPPCQ